MVNIEAYKNLQSQLQPANVHLVAVSKFKLAEDIQTLYEQGQRAFGENYVQELVAKHENLPQDIEWHFIGHLQSNKVKYIAPFVYMIHGVDSFKLLQEINKQAAKNNRVIKCLLQLHIAKEETKFGLSNTEAYELLAYYKAQKDTLQNVEICGVMGMASFSENTQLIEQEFKELDATFSLLKSTYFLDEHHFSVKSIGMTNDYPVAIACGGNMVRIGSLLFGKRN